MVAIRRTRTIGSISPHIIQGIRAEACKAAAKTAAARAIAGFGAQCNGRVLAGAPAHAAGRNAAAAIAADIAAACCGGRGNGRGRRGGKHGKVIAVVIPGWIAWAAGIVLFTGE